MKRSDIVLIVALSARALAQSARRAGLSAIAVDAFGDEDARASCLELVVAPNVQDSFAHCDLDALVAPLVRAYAPAGIVYGSGFEDCPEVLSRLERRARLIGAAPAAVARAKDPVSFSELCAAAGLLHPEIETTRPSGAGDWLLKRAGGGGGGHIRNAAASQTRSARDYVQRRIDGRSVSLLFARNEAAFTPLGWSEQWTSATPDAPYRYGGAAGPVAAPDYPLVIEALSRLAAALDLNGLASADFIDDGRRLWLLEVNPRPGATLDVFDGADDPLMRRHLGATNGPPLRASRGVKASAIVYAQEDIVIAHPEWPGWVADRPAAGTQVPAGAPLCTVFARSDTLPGARTSVAERARNILELIRKCGP